MAASHNQLQPGNASELLPCPLCQSANVAGGFAYVIDSPKEPAVRCTNCGCRATLKAWQARSGVLTRDAIIEECAKVAEAQAQTFLSPGYAAEQPMGSFCERFACEEVAKAIRSLALSSASRECQTCGGLGRIAHESGGYGINCPSCTVTSTHSPSEAK